jgi:hypothetical protein
MIGILLVGLVLKSLDSKDEFCLALEPWKTNMHGFMITANDTQSLSELRSKLRSLSESRLPNGEDNRERNLVNQLSDITSGLESWLLAHMQMEERVAAMEPDQLTRAPLQFTEESTRLLNANSQIRVANVELADRCGGSPLPTLALK